jgi:hypothetical protein
MPVKAPAGEHQSLKPLIISIALVCLGIVAYSNSLSGPFVYDDILAIRDNTDFGGQTEFGYTTLSDRPLLWLSFQADYAVAGKGVKAYHATNLLIHLTSGLLLFGIVRRNLMRTQSWGSRFQNSAVWLAAVVAVIWMVHPLTTAAVTFISQRAESLASLFYLLVIYCLIRAADSERASRAWSWGAIVACGLGTLTKETLVTAPLLALMYDRTFLAGSFATALRTRRWLYWGLASTWGIVAILVMQEYGKGDTVGYGLGISAIEYARTQLGVIAHYLRLAFWPRGLVLTASDWPIARHWNQIGVPGLLVAILVIVAIVAFWKWPRAGFLLVSIFIILAPSSSIIPIITEIEADHRMYLPLAAVVAMVVVGGWMAALGWRLTREAVVLAPALIVVLIILTMNRNRDYRSQLTIWADTINKRPNDWTAHVGYGQALMEMALACEPRSQQQRTIAASALPDLRRALALAPPKYMPAAMLLSTVLQLAGDDQESERFDTQLIQRYPDHFGEMLRRRGVHRLSRGNINGGRADFEAAIAVDPKDVEAHYYLGTIMQVQRDLEGARAQYQGVLQVNPHYRDVEARLKYLTGPPRDPE